MNWVQRRAKKEDAIRAGSEVLWQQLATSIADVAESYNERYGEWHGRVVVKPDGQRLWLIRRLQRASDGAMREHDIFLAVTLDSKKGLVTAEVKSSATKSVQIDVHDENAELFLSSDGKEISTDEASKILIEHFLFDRQFSRQPR